MKKNCLSLTLLVLTQVAISQSLTVSYQLKSKEFYSESEVPKNYDISFKTEKRPGDTLYRYFHINEDAYQSESSEIHSNKQLVWEKFGEKNGRIPESKDEFTIFMSTIEEGKFYLAELKRLAPVLKFRFEGLSNKQYILRRIIVKTIEYDEYPGGGYADKKSWYDIVLPAEKGSTKEIDMDTRLRFTGSGECDLRFWSDNYYQQDGETPMGCFMINIEFQFQSDLEEVRVQSGPFKIDV